MSSVLNNGGLSGALPSLTPQTSGATMVGSVGGGAAAGGMEELLPLVIQLTKPEQVRYRDDDRLVENSFIGDLRFSSCVLACEIAEGGGFTGTFEKT